MSKSRKRRIGIYPGTFDPIHQGHIAFAKEAMKLCELDKVIFLPEEIPRGKQDVTDITHRVALITLAIDDIPRLKVMRAASKQFDVAHTLPELRGIHIDSTLTLLIGSDVAKSLPNWEGIESLVGEVSFAIGMRSIDSLDEIKSIAHQVGALCKIIRTPEAHTTSTQVRSDTSLMIPGTKSYIEENQLYKK